MKSELISLFTHTLKQLDLPAIPVQISRPENSQHGEYTTNIAFILGKQQKQNPVETASRIVNYLEEKKKQLQNDEVFTILRDISSISIAGPGFINVSISHAVFSSHLSRVIKDQQSYGMRQVESEKLKVQSKEKPKIVIEYTDPNPFKELHIGHLYSNAVGESLSRLYESQGWEVRRVCYQGDVGLHVAKALWGMINKVKNEKLEVKSLPLEERARWLGEAYVLGANAYEEDPQAQEEIKYINILAFIAAQKMHEETGVKPVVDYKKLLETHPSETLQNSKLKLEEIEVLYRNGRAWSLEYFETQYKKLGTHFDGYYFESMVGELGYQTVKDHISDGIFEESDGAVVYKGEKKGLHTRVFINKLGLPTYEAKELGLAPKKYADWSYDKSIIVTGKEIDEYFKVLLAALNDVKPDLAQKTIHVSHGMVRLPEGKMSSRKGNVLTAEWLLGEVSVSIQSLVDKNASSYTTNDQIDMVQKATVAAVKYSLLKVALPADIAFDFKHSVSFDGDSGPYLLYTYARCKSVMRKASKASEASIETFDTLDTFDASLNSEEHTLARLIMYFPEIVEEAAENLSPSTIARYLIDVAQAFNVFYAKHSILKVSEASEVSKASEGNTENFRVQLTSATAQVLKNGLHLLGIETVERM